MLSANALVLEKRQDGAPRVVSLATQREDVVNPHKRDQERRRRKRAGTVQATLDNMVCALVKINGTPANSP